MLRFNLDKYQGSYWMRNELELNMVKNLHLSTLTLKTIWISILKWIYRSLHFLEIEHWSNFILSITITVMKTGSSLCVYISNKSKNTTRTISRSQRRSKPSSCCAIRRVKSIELYRATFKDIYIYIYIFFFFQFNITCNP